MERKFPEDFDFSPDTWLLPKQFDQMIKDTRGKDGIYIVKPELMSQG